jgi:SlyX protein
MDKQMDGQMDARIERLEETVAHLTRLTDELNEVMARQDAEVARLTRRVELLMLAEAAREADASGSIPLADQRPPHW